MRVGGSFSYLVLLTTLVWCGALSGCASTAPPSYLPTPFSVIDRNILLVIADDLGVDRLPQYQSALGISGVTPATTPTLESLSRNGVTFTRAWSNPTCSPTRAGIYSGFHAFRHDILIPTDVNRESSRRASLEAELAEIASALGVSSVPALPARLPSTYRVALFGKWHLGGQYISTSNPSGYGSPQRLGWETHKGSWEEIPDTSAPNDYCHWEKIDDDLTTIVPTTRYASLVAVEDALTWIQEQENNGRNWWATVAFNVPHAPYHALVTCQDCSASSSTDNRTCYRAKYLAMIQDMDARIGHLLDQLQTMGTLYKTIVIFVSDNGTPGEVLDEDQAHLAAKAKGTVSQLGVTVPLIVADGYELVFGNTNPRPQIRFSFRDSSPGRRSNALVHTLDIFATIAEIVGAGTESIARHSVSFAPILTKDADAVRSSLYTDGGRQGGVSVQVCAIRNSIFKLIRKNPCEETSGTNELYNLASDPWEQHNLLSASMSALAVRHCTQLLRELWSLRGWTSSPPTCP